MTHPKDSGTDRADPTSLPLAGVTIVEYAQYVAGPFASMLLADLGAEVIKVEPPGGDEWRRYNQISDGESRYFYSLNRNKRSIALDLKSEEDRRISRRLVCRADAVLHNYSPTRARSFGLDDSSVRALNPRCTVVNISAFGEHGPYSERPAYDLVAQALSGLLLSDPRDGDTRPHRAGGVAMADFTCGLLAAVAVLAGLCSTRASSDGHASHLSVSLFGAALAVQVQRLVTVEDLDPSEHPLGSLAGAEHLQVEVQRRMESEALEPYYRAYGCLDGFLALACLNSRQRVSVCRVLGLTDPWVANPQRPPADDAERRAREAHVRKVEDLLAKETVDTWVRRFEAEHVPVGEVRPVEGMLNDPHVAANGLVAEALQAPGRVRLLSGLFGVDGKPVGIRRPAPGLNEHRNEVVEETAASLTAPFSDQAVGEAVEARNSGWP